MPQSVNAEQSSPEIVDARQQPPTQPNTRASSSPLEDGIPQLDRSIHQGDELSSLSAASSTPVSEGRTAQSPATTDTEAVLELVPKIYTRERIAKGNHVPAYRRFFLRGKADNPKRNWVSTEQYLKGDYPEFLLAIKRENPEFYIPKPQPLQIFIQIENANQVENCDIIVGEDAWCKF